MSTPHTPPLYGAYTPISPAEVIGLWMDHFELSETDVALITGLPINTVTRLWRGSQRITDDIAAALADVTKIAARRWLALERHHAVWTQGVDDVLTALRGPTSSVNTQDQEHRMSQPPTPADTATEIPLYGTAATVRRIAHQWSERLNITGGTIGTATVLAQLAAMMREEGITYLSAADLDAISVAVHPAPVAQTDSPVS